MFALIVEAHSRFPAVQAEDRMRGTLCLGSEPTGGRGTESQELLVEIVSLPLANNKQPERFNKSCGNPQFLRSLAKNGIL